MRQEQKIRDEQTEAIRSEPVPVPPIDTDPDQHSTRTGADNDPTGRTSANPATDREHPYHDPAPVPTAFGATSVGGAVAASAMASDRPEDERDPREEEQAGPADGADTDRVDRTAGRTRADRDTSAALAAGATGYGSADPTMVDPDADRGTPPGTVPEAGSGPAAMLLGPQAAEDFRNRWREVQLRFVDDPQAAATDAEHLVGDAIEELSTALAAQRAELGRWQESGSEDTEQLRVAVRRYRDFLDRVLGR